MSVEDTDFSPPATAVMFLLTIHPTALEVGDFLSTRVKPQTSDRRRTHRPHLFVYDHFQFVNRCTECLHSRSNFLVVVFCFCFAVFHLASCILDCDQLVECFLGLLKQCTCLVQQILLYTNCRNTCCGDGVDGSSQGSRIFDDCGMICLLAMSIMVFASMLMVFA